jgi:ABC-2 type transport system permease protein
VLRAVVLGGAGYCLIGLLGLGFGAVVRHTALAVGLLVGGVYVVAMLGAPLAPAVMPWLPISVVANSLTVEQPGMAIGDVRFLSPWAGLGVLVLYAAVALGAGAWVLAERDA